MPIDFSDVGQAEVLTRELGSSLVFTTETGYLNFNGVYWEESEERAQGKVHELTSNQLDDNHKYEGLLRICENSGKIFAGCTTTYETWKKLASRQQSENNLSVNSYVWIRETPDKHFKVC